VLSLLLQQVFSQDSSAASVDIWVVPCRGTRSAREQLPGGSREHARMDFNSCEKLESRHRLIFRMATMATTRFFVGVLALIGACAPAHAARNYRVGAFYYGPWHVDPANEKLHGKNWTEWNLVKVICKPSIIRSSPHICSHVDRVTSDARCC
jgi:hypothetical protein